MTEREWQSENDIDRMLEVIQTSSTRKQRLFCVACCRSLAHRTDPCLLHAIDAAEKFCDQPSPSTEFDDAYQAILRLIDSGSTENDATPMVGAVYELIMAVLDPWRCVEACANERWVQVTTEGNIHEKDFRVAFERIRGLESETQCLFLRDVFGNPFRSVVFSPDWRTNTAVTLARTVYDSRDFSAMLILADALQDAGCDNDDILNHCRDSLQTHVRGCWVVDLVLGRE